MKVKVNLKLKFKLTLKFKMGAHPSKTYNDEHFIPCQRLFKLSYTVCKSVKSKQTQLDTIDLRRLLENWTTPKLNVFMQFLYQKLKFNGYTLKPVNIDFPYTSIDKIISQMNATGFPVVNNEFIRDIKFVKSCYTPSLNTIHYFLSEGRLLLAMVILDKDFISQALKLSVENLENIATDAVVIVGYDQENIFIKTNWFKFIVSIENRFIENNIKEIWDIDILTEN
jgi:hypothetical protein